MGNIINTIPSYNSNPEQCSYIPIIDLSAHDALEVLMSNDFYCTTELPDFFDFSGVLKYAADSIGNKTLDECINGDCEPGSVHGVNLDVIRNKDGRYAVRPLTLANPFRYYMLARDICNEKAWILFKECFKLYANEHIIACAIPMVKVEDKPDPFKGVTSILNWWNSMAQLSIELSLKDRYMFMTDITNCFGQINPESIAWALTRKDTSYQTNENYALSANIQCYLRAIQEGKKIGIPQGSFLFFLIAEIILGYTDTLLTQEISTAQAKGTLPKDLEYEILRYVDDYRIFCNDRDALDEISYIHQHILEQFNSCKNSSKTRSSTELITDSIKVDKAFYIFNTPIESKQIYKDEDSHERKDRGYDFDGFQKHLLFIYGFSRPFPNSGQLVTQLEAFSKRIEVQLFTKTITYEETTIDLDSGKTTKEKKIKELKGHLWENISAMVAIAVEVVANNLRAANNALKIASRLLADMRKEDAEKKKEIIDQIYKKLICIPNSAFLQVWLKNITHTIDDRSTKEAYDMPLCLVAANHPVALWNNEWLLPEIVSEFPKNNIVNRESLAKTG